MDPSRDHSRSTTPPSGRQASFRTTSPKPKRGFGSSTGRFDNPGCQSDAQREAKAEERLEALFAEPAEEGAQVVMGPTRCAAPWRLPTLGATALPQEPAQPLSMRAAPTDA